MEAWKCMGTVVMQRLCVFDFFMYFMLLSLSVWQVMGLDDFFEHKS